MKKILITHVLVALSSLCLRSQALSLSTNLVDLATLGSLNVDVAYSFSQHWSASAKVLYNPFTYNKETDHQFQLKSRGVSLGGYYWLWHSYSGFYFSAGGRFEEFNEGGILSKRTEEGWRIGGFVGTGYALMLSRHWNLDFGISMWMGHCRYKAYSCPRCGTLIESGEKFFLLPDAVKIALSYIF